MIGENKVDDRAGAAPPSEPVRSGLRVHACFLLLGEGDERLPQRPSTSTSFQAITRSQAGSPTAAQPKSIQAVGSGERDVLVIMKGFIPIDTMDDEPRLARSMRRLGSSARLIRFDRRGIGLSDPILPSAPPTLERPLPLTLGDRVPIHTIIDDLSALALVASSGGR